MKKSHFRYWELALLLALAVTILWGAASLGQQEELGRKVIRLHVIANSDSPEDQALKLRVRDRVLARAQEILEQSADMEQAEQALTAALPELTREARETLAAEGRAQPVQARLEPAEFPTKDYDGWEIPGPAGDHRGGPGAELVVRGVSAAVHRRRLPVAGRGTGRRVGGG